MSGIQLGPVDARFADIVWSHEPLPSGELVKLCGEELKWKKSTTYTVLKSSVSGAFFRTGTGSFQR